MPHDASVTRLVPMVTYEQMLERIRYAGVYPTTERAERSVRLVLTGLGRQLGEAERRELAARLPGEAAGMLLAERPGAGAAPLTGWGFVKDLATRAEAPLATTRWDVGSVLTVVAPLAGPDLLARILESLPGGYALLFGKAELIQAA
ncbi:DUF2267 domain-containing protein [Streptomyces sp. NPDC047002]|uniref:DUF2267 domain-containing protein n=1 Tax=Streptomyces sp. NPDC047002 TaxID=3155475 RepID=UPI003456D0F0